MVKNYFLGHTRLSIQDTSYLANQLMFSKDRLRVLILMEKFTIIKN